LIFLVFYFGF